VQSLPDKETIELRCRTATLKSMRQILKLGTLPLPMRKPGGLPRYQLLLRTLPQLLQLCKQLPAKRHES
jgi:hypothetical protein